MNIELAENVAEWRRKCLDGTMTQEEMVKAIGVLRAGRMSAQAASQAARGKKVSTAVVNAEDLMGEMEDL